MHRNAAIGVVLALSLLGSPATPGAQSSPRAGGIVIETDGEVAAVQPGPHGGGGTTVGHSFFQDVPGLRLVFRKRVLKPGAAIGHHVQAEDEIYYVLSGRGQMTLDGRTVDVAAGTAILTRTGSSHSLTQVGVEDLVVIINYEQQPK